jgi:hypothetical protein
MKKRPALLLVLALVSMVGFSSCVRDYICQCKITYSGQPGLPDSTVNEYNIRDTKNKAKQACENNSFTSSEGGINTKEDCHLY